MSQTHEKMLQGKIWPLVLSMAVPTMISMLVQALYNMVDSLYLSYIESHEEALAALSLAYPLQMLLVAFGVGLGIGIGACLSKALGQQNKEKVTAVATNGFLLLTFIFVIFFVLGFVLPTPFFKSQNVSDAVVEMGSDYLSVVYIFSFFQLIQLLYEKLLCATGKSKLAMIMQLVGAGSNILLDPLFIFTFNMGAKGAAVATIIAQGIGFLMGTIFNLLYNKELGLSLQGIKIDGRILKEILLIGIPTVAVQMLQSCMTFGINQMIGAVIVDDVLLKQKVLAMYGVFYKIEYIVLMIIAGLNNGIIPLISFNLGANEKKRVKQIMSASFILGLSITVLLTIGSEIFCNQLLLLFNASGESLDIGREIVRITSLAFVFASFSTLVCAFYQGLGNGITPVVITVLRLVVLLLPSLYVLGITAGYSSMWWASLFAEGLTAIYALVRYLMTSKKLLKEAE